MPAHRIVTHPEVRCDARLEAFEVWSEQIETSHVGAGPAGDEAGKAFVIHVLMCEHDHADVVD